MPKLQFPNGFLWGASTSAHQIEGNTHNDWSEWEKVNADRLAQESLKYRHLHDWQRIEQEATDPKNYISGKAADHYNRFQEDFDIAKSLNHNAHHFSIEWSRIEPEEGKFNEEAIEHYRAVIRALKERNILPFPTLWHWTIPTWLAEKGGVESREFPDHFERYTKFVVKHFRDDIQMWVTLNEPTSVIGSSYLMGAWPPQKKSIFAAWRAYRRLAAAHKQAYHAIHDISPKAQVGFGNILHSYEPYHRHSLLDNPMIWIGRFFSNRLMLLLTNGHNDFLTVQYYFHNRLRFPRKVHPIGFPQTDMGWEMYPKGIFNIIDHLKRHKLPIYVTENGLADALDKKRENFIKEHLMWIHKAIREGADVRGYFYWSLLDNFEWDKGYWPRFGLVEIDYATQDRTVRKSALAYAKICRENALEIEEE